MPNKRWEGRGRMLKRIPIVCIGKGLSPCGVIHLTGTEAIMHSIALNKLMDEDGVHFGFYWPERMPDGWSLTEVAD